MQCPNCHTDVDSGERFCKACGSPVPEAPPDPLIGQQIGGKYRIIKLLGEGGMGAVYHGEQKLGTNIRRVAIKTLHRQLSTDEKVKARFNRECGTIAGLEHPNTIQVYDFGTTDDGQLYIVMEFVQGKSLADTLERDGPMAPERAEAILKQICGSLEEAHAQGIVHRDLKPDNVVLTERAGQLDFVKVLDFGIAKRSGEEDKNEAKLTQAGMVLGTPPYMSPEQFTGRPIDVRSDIYSLGVMAYEMLTGKLPFEAETAWEWATKHMTAAPYPMEARMQGLRAPENMRQAVMRALSKPVEQRFQTVREFYEAFAVTGPRLSLPGSGPTVRGGPGGTELLSQPGVAPTRMTPAPQPSGGGIPKTADLAAMSGAGFQPGAASAAPFTPGGPAQYGPPGGPAQYGPPGGTDMGPMSPHAMGPQGYAPQTIPSPGGGMPPPHGMPTGGNVAYTAPAPPAKGGGGKLFLFIALGLLVAGGAGAAIFVATRPSTKTIASATAATTTTAPTTPPTGTTSHTTAGGGGPDEADAGAVAHEPHDAGITSGGGGGEPEADAGQGEPGQVDAGVHKDAGHGVVVAPHVPPAVCNTIPGLRHQIASAHERHHIQQLNSQLAAAIAQCRAGGGKP